MKPKYIRILDDQPEESFYYVRESKRNTDSELNKTIWGPLLGTGLLSIATTLIIYLSGYWWSLAFFINSICNILLVFIFIAYLTTVFSKKPYIKVRKYYLAATVTSTSHLYFATLAFPLYEWQELHWAIQITLLLPLLASYIFLWRNINGMAIRIRDGEFRINSVTAFNTPAADVLARKIYLVLSLASIPILAVGRIIRAIVSHSSISSDLTNAVAITLLYVVALLSAFVFLFKYYEYYIFAYHQKRFGN